MSGVEINHYGEGSRYSGVRIPSLDFVGIADWSPNKRFGLVVGTGMATRQKLAILLADGQQQWRMEVENPLDIRLTDDCVGVFVDRQHIHIFDVNGMVCQASPPPGLGKIIDFKATPEGFEVRGERTVFLFDMAGRMRKSDDPEN